MLQQQAGGSGKKRSKAGAGEVVSVKSGAAVNDGWRSDPKSCVNAVMAIDLKAVFSTVINKLNTNVPTRPGKMNGVASVRRHCIANIAMVQWQNIADACKKSIDGGNHFLLVKIKAFSEPEGFEMGYFAFEPVDKGVSFPVPKLCAEVFATLEEAGVGVN